MLEQRRIHCEYLNLNQDATLTVIVPIRAMRNRDITDRINYCLDDRSLDRDKIDFLVVDDGSDEESSQKISSICKENHINYIYLDTCHRPFSIARARNIGAMYSNSKYIMFMDVDLYPYDGFYNDLLNEIIVQKLDNFENDFIMIGVIYLTQNKGNNFFFDMPREQRKSGVIQKLLENDLSVVEKFSTGTSVNLYSRRTFLARGGNNEIFEEWGYEDLEFNVRMIRNSKKFPYPKEMGLDFKNFRTINEYKGWKSIYRLFGDITFQKGIVLTHVWHDVDQKSDYMKGKEKNRKLFEDCVNKFSRRGIEPAALPCIGSKNTLIFSETNPFVCNRNVLSVLGPSLVVSEDTLSENNIVPYLKSHNIDQILMFNPYGSEHRLSLYQALKSENIPVIVAERGALRDSVFYDWNGFNAESSSYNKENWDFPLTEKSYKKVDDYIAHETGISDSLEKQVDIMGASAIRKKLNIPLSKKVLLVPLQRPSDSVIKYFCGPIGSYENFLVLVSSTIKALKDDWVVVIKKHPLEDNMPALDGALYSDANIKDLLEMCDASLLINSGVGLLSMLWGKPVLYCGDVFYGDDRINRQVAQLDDVVTVLEGGFKSDKETIYRFLYFLLDKFYSFGVLSTKEVPWIEGGRMTVTTNIDFYQVRNLSKENFNQYVRNERRIKTDSILFDRYTGRVQQIQQSPIILPKDVLPEEVKISSPSFRETQKRKFSKLRKNPKRYFSESKSITLRVFSKVL